MLSFTSISAYLTWVVNFESGHVGTNHSSVLVLTQDQRYSNTLRSHVQSFRFHKGEEVIQKQRKLESGGVLFTGAMSNTVNSHYADMFSKDV